MLSVMGINLNFNLFGEWLTIFFINKQITLLIDIKLYSRFISHKNTVQKKESQTRFLFSTLTRKLQAV